MTKETIEQLKSLEARLKGLNYFKESLQKSFEVGVFNIETTMEHNFFSQKTVTPVYTTNSSFQYMDIPEEDFNPIMVAVNLQIKEVETLIEKL